jgi:protoporphyrinogen oxidase
VFHYPRKGFGQIVDAMAGAATRAGADVRTGVEISAVHARPDGVRVLWDGGAVRARQAFSTLPLTTLGRLARPAPSAQAVQDAAGLQFRAMVLVYLVHQGGRWTGYDAHYLPGAHTPITRISEPANYRVSADDPDDRSVLCVEIPCAAGDPVWRMDEHQLLDLVRAGLVASGLPEVRLPAGGVDVRRLPHVYPVYACGYAQRLAGIEAWADRLANVTTFGRLGLFVHDNTHHAMRMAYDAVDCLRPDGSMDPRAWAAARERFASHVVED